VFLDEAAKDERTSTRRYGYSTINQRARKSIVFVRGKRYTILPALSLDGIIAFEILEGSYTKDKFHDFILDQVVTIVFDSMLLVFLHCL
jgi:DDE superfamily endonuclease